MPSTYPTTDDVFTEPASPGSTALSSAGSGSRTHTQHHRDLGDAVEAIEANAAILTHDHSNTEARPTGKLTQANTHQSPDTDVATSSLHHTIGTSATQAAAGNHTHTQATSHSSPDTDAGPTSLHHTIGSGANQAAAGNHTHGSTDPYPVGSIYLSVNATNPNSLFGGTWVQIQDAFLVAAGSTFTAASTGGASTHTHTTSSTGAAGTHTHTNPSTSTTGNHTHTNPTTSSNGSHTHSTGSNSSEVNMSGGGIGVANSPHTHTVNSGGSHTHTQGSTGTTGDHNHTIGTTGSVADHTHTNSATGSESNLPPYLAVYVFKRTA